jgi:hypothetical protein
VTIHYHGTPITPRSVLHTLAGKHFCVSYAAPNDATECHKIGQSVMLDNGAFSLWRAGKATDWPGYYKWAEYWLSYPSTWAVIPDVIDGSDEQNDALIAEWPFKERGAPVWHLHEPIERLCRLVDHWPRVCFGSSGQFAAVASNGWHRRVTEAFNAIARAQLPWVHMLRGMSMAGSHYPFASVDSTDVARNHNRPQNNARKMADRWDSQQCPGHWTPRPTQAELVA